MTESNPSTSQEPIDLETFAHLVALAALELTDEESEYLRRELNQQLKAIRALESIEVEKGTPITSHGVPYADDIRPPIREDVASVSKEADAILEQAPEAQDRFIVVPDIPHEALE